MIVLVAANDALRDRVAESAPAGSDVRSVHSASELERLVRGIGRWPAAVVVGPSTGDDAIATAESIASLYPSAGIVLLSPHVDSDLLRRGMRAGLVDVLAADASSGELREALGRAVDHGHVEAAPEQPGMGAEGRDRGRVVTVFSTKGGSGKSLVAVNLAVLLAASHKDEVVLVDLDLQSGDVAILLQLLPAWTIEDAARNADRLDQEAVRGYLTRHRSGVQILAAPLDPAMSEVVTADAIHRLLSILRSMFPYVIVDGPAFFTDQILAALDDSDTCILVGSLDVPSIKNLKLALQTLSSLGIDRDRIHVALNRADSHVGLNIPEVEKSLGTPIDVSIPSSREVPLSVNQGTPIAQSMPKSAVTKSLHELAHLVAGEPVGSAGDQGARRFRLFGKD
jgi:pilus assembly protein CpaE